MQVAKAAVVMMVGVRGIRAGRTANGTVVVTGAVGQARAGAGTVGAAQEGAAAKICRCNTVNKELNFLLPTYTF